MATDDVRLVNVDGELVKVQLAYRDDSRVVFYIPGEQIKDDRLLEIRLREAA